MKPGDRVHVEFDGELGTGSRRQWVYVHVTGLNGTAYVPLSAVTLLSPAKPEWAERPGTIVRCAAGRAATCSSSGAWWVTTDAYIHSYESLFQDYGPLTLLYDPEANDE